MRKERTPLLFSLAVLWAVIILAIGIWWLYLLYTLDTKFIPVGTNHPNLASMIRWEGGTFILLLLFLSGTLWNFYIKERRYTNSLANFFAGITHELKTPLASIRLQAEAIDTFIKDGDLTIISKLAGRLTEDTATLETQLDKLLHLSRVERGGKLNLLPIDFGHLIKEVVVKSGQNLNIKFDLKDTDRQLIGDHYALELILKNLLENTKRHSQSKSAIISNLIQKDRFLITYQDDGKFNGDPKKIGQIFYKHNSAKGSGIGLYLIRKLTESMNGRATFDTSENTFKVTLNLPLNTGAA